MCDDLIDIYIEKFVTSYPMLYLQLHPMQFRKKKKENYRKFSFVFCFLMYDTFLCIKVWVLFSLYRD